MNSREKGKRGERQWRDELRANGYRARRGQQFAGGVESPDVVCEELSWIHFEVKAVERLNIEDAMDQARRDGSASRTGQQKTPVVAHRRSHRRWLVTMDADFFFELIREYQPQKSAKSTAREYARPTLVRTAREYARPTDGRPAAREYARPTLVRTARGDARPTLSRTSRRGVPTNTIFRRDAEKDPRDGGSATGQRATTTEQPKQTEQ